MAEREKNNFTWWKGAWPAAERGQFDAYLKEHPIVMNQIEPGYYRSKNKAGRIVPVVFWDDSGDGSSRCQVDDRDMDEKLHWTIFTFASKRPISLMKYQAYKAEGKWPDEHELAAADRELVRSNDPNLPDPNSLEGLTARLDVLAGEADTLITAGAAADKLAADRAADLKNQVAALGKAIEAKFKTEKAPLDSALADVRAKFSPEINRANRYKTDLNLKVLTPWVVAENKRIEAERAQARTLAAEAERENSPRPTSGRWGKEKVENASAGNFGRKTHMRGVWLAEITDREAFLAAVKDSSVITEALQAIANTYAKTATRPEIPGLSYKEEQRAV